LNAGRPDFPNPTDGAQVAEETHDRDYSGDYFQSRFVYDARREAIWSEVCAYLQVFVPPEAAVLDLGAGYCSFINHIVAAEKHALDLYPGFARFARPDVKTYVAGCDNLAVFSDNQLDVVFSSNLLEHLTRTAIEATLAEVWRVLKPSGRFILIQPNFKYSYREYFDDYTHLQPFTHLGLADWLTARGFRVERVEPRFLPFSFRSHLPKARWLARLYLRLPFRPLAKQMLLVSQKIG
jgi:ubiquinone/menaquinone biosynthesis C-methylase UbiE